MIKNNQITRKSISILLILTLLITGFFITPVEGRAETITTTKTFVDIGYYDIWLHADGVTWQKGIKPGSSVSPTFTISVAGVVASKKVVGCTGKFYDEYSGTFYRATVTSGNVASCSYSNEEVTYTVDTSLYARVEPEDKRKEFQAQMVRGERYYIPVEITLTFEEDVIPPEGPEPEEINAEVNMPATAKTGETFNIADGTLVGSETIVDEVDLYIKVDNGEWEYETTWIGTGKKGENTGGRIQKSYDTPCTVEGKIVARSEGGLEDTDTNKTIVEDGREMNGVAVLVPESNVTYENHHIYVYDESTFDVNGEKYSAKRAYAEGIARSSYKVSGGTVKKDGSVAAICTFPKAGFYTVILTVTLSNGQRLTDSTVIEVRKTPYIIDNLGGFQKQNRKQVLTLDVAISPTYPISEYDIRIKDLTTSEVCTLSQDILQDNGASIKTRMPVVDSSGQYWETITVEFLTKYPSYALTGSAPRKFSYYAKVTDSKGDSDEAYKEFEVAPDVPPIPAISMQDSFLRAAGTNTANIEAADASQSDGDQLQRTWSVAYHNPLTGLAAGQANTLATIPTGSFANATLLSGYQNLAFGINQTIGFKKEGVGKSTVKLHVKDVWNEPTLEEYINPSDYLEAETTASTEVINIAPVVSIEPLNTLKANIAILVSANKAEAVKNQINSLHAALIENGIDGNVSVIPIAEPYAGVMTAISSLSIKGAYNAGAHTSDSERVYLSVPVTTNQSYSRDYASQVKIVAYNKACKAIWSYNMPPNEFVSSLYVDDKEKYLIANCHIESKTYTLIFNAKTGAFLKKIDNTTLNGEIFLSTDESRLFCVSTDGVYRLHLKTGICQKIMSDSTIQSPRLNNGKIGYVGRSGDAEFYIGYLDINSEKSEKKNTPTIDITNQTIHNGSSDYRVCDWDINGNILVSKSYYKYGDAYGGVVYLLNVHTSKQITLNNSSYANMDIGATLAKDEKGNSRYIAISVYGGEAYEYSTHTGIYDINGNLITNCSSGESSKRHCPSNGYYDSTANRVYFLEAGYYGKYICYDLTNKEWVAVWNSIQDLGVDVITGNVELFDGRLTSLNIAEYNSYFDIHQYKLPITADQSSYNGITKNFNYDSTEKDSFAVFYGISNLAETSKAMLYQGVKTIMTNVSDGILSIAEKIKEKENEIQYKLYLSGTASNPSSIEKKINLLPNKTYNYSYNLQTVSSAAIDLFTTQKTSYPNTYYRKPIYYVDLTKPVSDSVKKGMVSYNEGAFFNGEKYAMICGFGGGTASRWGDMTNGPNISFTMEEDGYVEFNLSAYGKNTWSLYLDDGLIYVRDGGLGYITTNEKRTILVSKGKHTIRGSRSSLSESGVFVLRSLELGYISDKSIEKQTLSISNSENVETEVQGKIISNGAPIYRVLNNFVCKGTILNGMDLNNKGYLTTWGWTRWVDGILYGEAGDRPKDNGYTITAPSDKILIINNGNVFTILQPATSYSFNKRLPKYSYFVPILSGCSVVEIPLNSGISGYETFSKGVKYCYLDGMSGSVPIQFIKSVDNGDGTATMQLCETIPPSDNSTTISFSTASSTNTLNALISNFKLEMVDSKNTTGIQYSEKFASINSLSDWVIKAKGNGIATMKEVEPVEKEEDTPLVYKKGQLIKYGINYSDYEKDPSKSGYWLYAHTPYNDGEHENAAIIYDEDGNIKSVCGQGITPGAVTIDEALNIAKSKGLKILAAPIDRFYVDGKYTVYHWEYDNTSRGIIASGYPIYDKVSNTAELTFYVEGGASAPWITGISTSPAKVTENNYFSLNIGIDDAEKDILNLTTEVYKDRKLIYTHRKKNINPFDSNGKEVIDGKVDNGRMEWGKHPVTGQYGQWPALDEPQGQITYPVTNTGALPDKAEAGTYEVVATVRDQTGAGIGTYKFIVVSEGKITGYVNHTDKWDENRKKYNLSWFDSEVNTAYSYTDYLALSEPRKRGTNVFWSGEKFMLRAAVAGSPTKVTCNINGTSYNTNMISSGTKNAEGETIYTGSLWNKDMINKWGMKEPEQLTFTFTATYSGGIVKTHKATVIVDNRNPYWRLHRAF